MIVLKVEKNHSSTQTSLHLRRPPTHTRSSSVSSFRSTFSNLKRGQQSLGALVAVVRPIYNLGSNPIFSSSQCKFKEKIAKIAKSENCEKMIKVWMMP